MATMTGIDEIGGYFQRHAQVVAEAGRELAPTIDLCGEKICAALEAGKKILIAGNGGSAADAQHFAAELVGRFLAERRPLPAVALTTDTSALTAIGNDYGFDRIFSRQVEALAQPGDIFFGISTSGHSANILAATESARQSGCTTIGLLGRDGGRIAALVDLALVVPAQETPHIQEVHIMIIHLLCALVDRRFAPLTR